VGSLSGWKRVRNARGVLWVGFLVGMGLTGCDAHGDEHLDHNAGHHHDLPATGGEGYTAADVRFMQMMMGHHAQALSMAELAPDRAADAQVLFLAQKIDISQRDEIAFMQQWLEAKGQVLPDLQNPHAMEMPGMVTEAQLAALARARGSAFDRLFLELMIQHHEGAVEMVDALFESPGAAQDSEIFRFVTDVSADQLDEIGAMDILLLRLTSSGS
jgi:uncharacterized protein (DUF305 family)